MKRIYFFLLINLFAFQLFASDLVLIRTSNYNETKGLFENPALTINLFNDQFVIATLDGNPKAGITVLDQNAWIDNSSYYLVYIESQMRATYLTQISSIADVLFDGNSFLVVKIDETIHGQLTPAKNDGMIRIVNKAVSLPTPVSFTTPGRLDPDPFIVQLLGMVNSTNVTATVQQLQNYGTRNCYQPTSVQAQNWIKSQFEGFGLSVEIMDFPMSGGNASDNVIATKVGTKYPDEYVVLGSHYDSYSYSGLAPGADDNASGSAGIIEVARILSQYDFDRTIIFCTFSGEEYGLYGSTAYANRCAQQGMDILGYFNMDMVGYLKPGDPIHTDIIYPSSAQPLATFYTEVCSVYLPDFIVGPGSLSGGDSDHTSFNNAGFMGIFPFEDSQDYSPYIHTSNDIIGPSYNNAAQAGVFTQAILASVVKMANLLTPPKNLVAIPGNNVVDLQWDQMVGVTNYKVYRNDVLVASPVLNNYHDINVVNGTQYKYFVTAIYSDTGEESDPSNIVYTTPMPPIALPLVIDFESGAPYWNFEDTWGISTTSSHSPTHSITESPTGNYGDNKNCSATLNSINLSGYTAASVSFWTKYDLELNYDYMKLEVSTNGSTWTQLASFNGTQSSWQQKTYPLTAYLGQPYVVIRFHFTSDVNTTKDGMYIDDFTITVEGGTTLNPPQNLAASVSNNDVTLTWTAPATDALLGYNVYRGGAMIAQQITALTYVDMDLPAGTYSYQVCAVYTEGTSAMAGPVQAVITGGTTSNAWETFEDYTAGQKLATQANAMGRTYWTTWSNTPGSAEDPAVSNAVAHDGNNSVIIQGTNDCVLLLGNKTSGKYSLNFYVNIPTGFYGYFNVLQNFAGANSVWGTQAYFDANGVGSVDAGGEGAGSFTYSYNTWIFVEVVVDLDADWAEFYVNGADVVQWQWSLGTFGTPGPVQLSAANFYAWAENGTPKAYFDDIDFKPVTSSLIFEPFEDYTAGQKLVQQAVAQGKDYWTTWSNTPGSAEDPIVSTEHAFAGSNSVLCQGTNDFVMLFGDKTSGKYSVNFYIYIPTGKVGYYNILQKFAGASSIWGSEVYYNPNGTAKITANGTAAIASFTYGYDQWIYMENIIDLNSDHASIKVNGTEVYAWQWSVGASGGGINQLGGMDIYAATTNGSPYFFVDDIEYKEFLSLAAPTNLVASVNDNDITLTWNAPPSDGFLGYNVYRGTQTIATLISTLTFTDYDLLPGTYAYDVKAVYDEGYSPGAGPVNATIAGGTAREMVILEIGTGTWCQYCPGAAMGADQLTENGKDVAIIEYHSGDTYETTESGYRVNTYYGITGFPTAYFDGVISVVGGSQTQSMYAAYLPRYETRSAKVSLFELSIEPVYLGGTNFNLTVNANNIYPYPGNNLVLHVVCTESHIPVNWYGQTEVNFVCRKMMPDQMGTAINFGGQPNHTITLPLNYGTWNIENCQAIAFIQDNTTKEILQATRVDLGLYVGIQNPEVAANLSVYPNPATNQVNIATSGTLTQVKIMNNTGQLIFNQITDGQLLQINTSSFNTGVYFIEIHTTQGMTTQKLVIR